MNHTSKDAAYTAAGVDLNEAEGGLKALTAVLATIDPGRPSRAAIGPGHYATVLAIDDRTGVAVATDGIGTKIVIAQQIGKFDTVGIDCIAMNVNDVICVGAEPIAVLDYLAVEEPSPTLLAEIGAGLKKGAELAGIEIPGGELAQVRELLRGHPSPYGFDLVGTCIGTVALDQIITGGSIAVGDAIIGLPSSGVHSNGLTLARRALLERGGLQLDQRPGGLECTVGEALLEPTEIYVQAIKELLGSGADVHGLAHITGGGLSNLLRLNDKVGYEITDPLPVPPIFNLIQELGTISEEEMYEVFNMGMGFCCIVSPGSAERAVELLKHSYDKARSVGRVTDLAGKVTR